MKIIDIFQMPTGTIVNVDEKSSTYAVNDSVVANGKSLLIKGFALHDKSSIMIEKTNDLSIGQEIKIFKIV